MITTLIPDNKNFIGENEKYCLPPWVKSLSLLWMRVHKLGVSSRGMGSLEQKNELNYVRDDFYLNVTALTLFPTHRLQGIRRRYYEGKEWVWTHGGYY